MWRWLIAVGIISIVLTCSSKETEIPISLDEFVIQDGYQIDIIASEPLIEAPVAIDWDDKGRLWVLEMPDYMPDIDGVDEDKPRGRVVILEDTDGNGRMDKATPFMEALSQPRALKLINGGLLYAESPNLWFVEIINDRPANKTLVDSLYATGGNVEHKANGLLYNVDNWLYNAKSNHRYRYRNGKWLKEPTAFRGQWGITSDKWGYIYANDNSNGLYGDFVLPVTASAHPSYQSKHSYTKDVLANRAIFPLHATSINRGYNEGMLDEEGKPQFMTSTCGPHISQGSVNAGDGFICVPEGNIIKQVSLTRDNGNVNAAFVYNEEEFLASTDETFRPVNINTGTDGALYITDFHRGVIQHRVYMTAYLRDLLIGKGLHEAVGMGRIWKITKEGQPNNNIKSFSDQSITGLVDLLSNSNGANRIRAQQELIQRNNDEVIEIIIDKLDGVSDIGKLHILYVVEALQPDKLEGIIRMLLTSPLPYQLHVHIVKLIEENCSPKLLLEVINRNIENETPELHRQIAHSTGKLLASHTNEASTIYKFIMERYPADDITVEMLISGLQGYEGVFEKSVSLDQFPAYASAFSQVKENIKTGKKAPIHRTPKLRSSDGKTAGRELFAVHCAACHGRDGLGIENLAPSLADAAIINSNIEHVALTLFTGLTGPVTINGKTEKYNAAMPGVLSNPDLTDQDIANIASYISNAFSKTPKNISADKVCEIRKKAASFEQMPTEKEILSFN